MNDMIPSGLSDRDLEAEVARLAGCERKATASLIAHLAELYSRRLHERAGYSSLFTYCMGVLRLSEHEAYDRMKAAKVVRRYPAVLGLLASGRVNLTTVRLLAPHLTRGNHEELFAAACGKRKRQVQELLARRFPKPDVPSSVRKLPPTKPGVVVPPAEAVDPQVRAAVAALHAAVPSIPPLPPPSPPPPVVLPLAPDRYRVTFTATEETCEMLQLAQDLLRHAVPSGDPAQVVGRALKLLVQELVKQKYAATDRPRASRGRGEDASYTPAEVKRAVYIRDRGRCAFVGTHGRRCGERAFVEFHHLIPRAVGGEATVDNISLRCRAHNGYEVDVFFGPGKRYVGADFVSQGAATYRRVSDDAIRSRTKAVRAAPEPNRMLPLGPPV